MPEHALTAIALVGRVSAMDACVATPHGRDASRPVRARPLVSAARAHRAHCAARRRGVACRRGLARYICAKGEKE